MVESSLDRYKGLGQAIKGSEKAAWDNTATQLGLSDVSGDTGFTWANGQVGECFRAARLDRVYMSNAVMNVFDVIDCHAEKSLLISDHYPVIFSARKVNGIVKNGWFHADVSLLKLDVVQSKIRSILCESFNFYRSPTKAWVSAVKAIQNSFRHFKAKAEAIRANIRMMIAARIDELEGLSLTAGTPSVELVGLKNQLKKEELLMASRLMIYTREHWFGRIDKPNKDMFKLLRRKKCRELVPPLKDSSGNTLTSPRDNLKLVHEFYSKIFSIPPAQSDEITLSRARIAGIRPKVVTPLLQKQLDRPFSLLEIEDCIDSLALGKTPGIDGLPNEFYKVFKKELSPLLLRVWNESVAYGALPISVNTGVVKLIHKRGAKDILDNWRPITCLTSIYKIFALVLTKRITHLLHSILLSEQKGFIKGRFILDAIISLWEGINLAQEEDLDFIFLKIDFDKAYDRVEWDFVLQSLSDMGMGKNFCHYVNCLFGNARCMIALNGTLSDPITLRRSIRQGCPLAPLLFVIAADALGWLVSDSMNRGELQGIKIPNSLKYLCLQQFADDTNALVINNPSSVNSFWECLNTFCCASGSKINHTKTGFWSSKGSFPAIFANAGCKQIKDGEVFRLLGIPMGFNVSLGQRWAWVMGKIKRKFEYWQGYQPSLSSRLFVLNHFLLPATIFFLSCWRPP